MANKRQTITTKLDADSKGLNDALTSAQTGLKRTQKEASKTKSALGEAFKMPKNAQEWKKFASNVAVGVGAVAASVAGFVKHFADLRDQAEALNITGEGLQRLDNASRKAGTSTDNLHSAYTRFTTTLASAQKGSARAEKALNRLGLTSQDLAMGGEAAFLKAAGALGNMQNATERNAAAMAVFGNSTAQTQKALAECVKTGQSMAGIVPDKTVQNIAKLASAFESIKDSVINSFADSAFGKTIAWIGDALQEIDEAGQPRTLRIGGVDIPIDGDVRAGADLARAARANEAVGKLNAQGRALRANGAAYAGRFEPGEEEKIEELQRATRQEEARKAALEEMRRASLTPQQREWEDYQIKRGKAIADMRTRTGWNQSQAEAWAQKVWDPQNMPNSVGNQGFTPSPMPSFSQPVAVASSGVGLDAILGAILSLRANTYIVK